MSNEIVLRSEKVRQLVGRIPSTYLKYGILIIVLVVSAATYTLYLIKVPQNIEYSVSLSDDPGEGVVIVSLDQHTETLYEGKRLFAVNKINGENLGAVYIESINEMGQIAFVSLRFTRPIEYEEEQDIVVFLPSEHQSILDWIIKKSN